MKTPNYSKIAVISDIHGESLKDLDKALNIEKIDLLVCLGDFDQTRTIHEYIKLEKKYNTITVPGNHDHAHLTGFPIESDTIDSQNTNSEELSDELQKDSVAKKYIEGLVNGKHSKKIFLDKKKFGTKFQTGIVHGAYDGNLMNYSDCPKETQDLWMRLLGENDLEDNFKAMDEKGERIMLRGHDHIPLYVCKQTGNMKFNSPLVNAAEFKLSKNAQHIITVGALFNGWFAVIDTNIEEIPILKYLRL